jgi:hypothetical protein
VPVGGRFGSRQLPPPSLLPAQVCDVIAAHNEAVERVREARATLTRARRDDLAAAKRADTERAADEIERGKAPGRPQNEERALDKIAALERQVGAAELVERRALERMDEVISAHADQIREGADERLARARAAYLETLDALEAVVSDLVVALALHRWAGNPSVSYKQSGLRPVPIPRHSSDGVRFASAVAGLRELVPSPVAAVAGPESTPAAEPSAPAVVGIAAR